WPRDWSSDVCSSDLGNGQGAVLPRQSVEVLVRCALDCHLGELRRPTQPEQHGLRQDARHALVTPQEAGHLVKPPRGRVALVALRSEERRVGKEGGTG